MKKYDYFEDDDENISASNESNFSEKLKNALFSLKDTVRTIFDKDTISQLDELPHLKRRVLKLSAFLAFVLVVIIFIACFSHSINAQNKKNETFCKNAGEVCTQYIKEYGSAKYDVLDAQKYGENQARLTGLCYARQMDFNGDGDDELMVCYNNKNVYYLEVWGYSHKKFVRLYSKEANSTENVKDGVWVGFYYDNGKYYICKSEKASPESVTLLALHGDEFKETSKKWDYDFENDIYSKKGKINANSFETIPLAVFRKSRAEIIISQVSKNIDAFGNISSKAITNNKSKAQLEADEYYSVVKRRLEKYGAPEIVDENGYSYISGVAMVRLIDFDGNGDDELMIVYRKYKTKSKYDNYSGEYIYYEVPMYSLDVYDFNSTSARRIFSKESVSNCLLDENENVFYLMMLQGKKTTNIYNNVYTFENNYKYTASSKVYRMKKGKFETTYSAKLENDYGYKRYYIDNESVYSSEFDERGHKVPMFLDDDAKVDTTKYSLYYLSGKNTSNYQEIINETNNTIKKLNPDYSPEEEAIN